MRDHLPAAPAAPATTDRPILITGATGRLGQALAAACRHRDLSHVLTARPALDPANGESIAAALDLHRPWIVLDAAGWSRVDQAEIERDACLEANAIGATWLAAACADRGIATIGFSSDLVFDGRAGRPYLESDALCPLNSYGRNTALTEAAIGALAGTHLIVRTAAFFSPFDAPDFAVHAIDALAAGRPFAATCDQVVTPTYLPDLCNAVLDLAIDREPNIWHLAGSEGLSRADFARRLAVAADLDDRLVIDCSGRDLGWATPRSAAVILGSERGSLLPPLESAIERFVLAMRKTGRLPSPADRIARRAGVLRAQPSLDEVWLPSRSETKI